MEKLEKILYPLVFAGATIALIGAGLDKRAIIYDQVRTVSRILFYGGVIETGIFTLFAAYLHDKYN